MVKKNILIISPRIPCYDTNAGDFRVFSFIKTLGRYFNVFFMPVRNDCPVKYKAALKKYIGKIIDKTDNIASLVIKHKIDSVIFEKYWDLPFELYKLMPLFKQKIVDVHEIGFIKTAEQSKIKRIKNQKIYKEKELLFYRGADLLITISEEEKNELKKYFPDKKIMVIPACTQVQKKINRTFNKRKDICYFGFFKHQPNADAMRYFIKNIFNKLSEKMPGIKLHILGCGAEIFKNISCNITVKDNIKNITSELSKYRLFVCPLRYGAGIKKKVLDAMAAGTPVIGTKFAFEGIKNMHKQAISLSGKKFTGQIKILYTDEKKWNKISLNGFQIVKRHYSMGKFNEYMLRLKKAVLND